MLRRPSEDFVKDLWGIRISRNSVQPLAPGVLEIPLRTTSSGFLSGEVHLEGIERPLNFIVDTGASVSVVSESPRKKDLISSGATRMRIMRRVSLRRENVLLHGRSAQLRATNYGGPFGPGPVNETAGFTQMGILGANYLRHFRVSFDFQRGLLRLEPLNQKTNSADVARPNEHLDQ